MLVLSRKPGERIVIGDSISIVVNRISGNRVSIGVEAPADVKIIRGELEQFVDQYRPEAAVDEESVFTSSHCNFDGPKRLEYPPRAAR